MKKNYTLVDKDGICVSCGMDGHTGALYVRRVDITLCDMMEKGMAESELMYVNKMLEKKLMVNADCVLPLRIAKVEVTRTIKEL